MATLSFAVISRNDEEHLYLMSFCVHCRQRLFDYGVHTTNTSGRILQVKLLYYMYHLLLNTCLIIALSYNYMYKLEFCSTPCASVAAYITHQL